ncbi:MAG: hypothetical protein K0Q72_522 [Armatimonadetes bacterium]|nr:hypothetical protein [Armatimonadota bacterium]
METAHVLFMDIVGYSRLSMDQQRDSFQALQEVVRATPELRQLLESTDTLSLPTGDGMALVFFHDPITPLRCALHIAGSVRTHVSLPLRMGLHTGPVYRVQDINTHSNVSGAAINIAQRIMDCGDAGHILLSREIAGLCQQAGAWPLQDLGICDGKHGERLHLFNLYTGELGNPRLPERLRTLLSADPRGRGTANPRVALLYKRNAYPDNDLLDVLEERLRAAGCIPFVDRHLEIGVTWAREIEHKIRDADAVIPLISAASAQSEMLALEVQTAAETAYRRGGVPRLLPVRIAYDGLLPDALAAVLDPIEYALWQSAADTERIAEEVVRAVRDGARVPTLPRERLEPVGGAVPLDSEFYVVRPADDELRSALVRRDSIVLVKGARQMGKTSLLARGLQHARTSGARVFRTDFQKLNAQHLVSADTLFLKLAESISDQLGLDFVPETSWQTRRGPSENFERFWVRHVFPSLDEHLVWGLDEVDRLFTCDFGTEVFGLFRSWHNERALDPDGPWKRLTLAIAYATEAHLFIADINQSPFNVGTRLTLADLNLEQLNDLNRRHGSPLRSEAELARFARLLGGHPYLVRKGLLSLASQDMDLETLEREAHRDEGVFGDHLRRLLVLLAREPVLCDAIRAVLQDRPCPSPESFFRLRSAGVVIGTSASDARPRCRLYASYLRGHFLDR